MKIKVEPRGTLPFHLVPGAFEVVRWAGNNDRPASMRQVDVKDNSRPWPIDIIGAEYGWMKFTLSQRVAFRIV